MKEGCERAGGGSGDVGWCDMARATVAAHILHERETW